MDWRENIGSQSPVPQQVFCSGSTPSPVEKIIPRADADVPDWYAAWATDFTLPRDEYYARDRKGLSLFYCRSLQPPLT